MDALEETVLVRLGANELDATEYADESVDAVDPCRSGLDDCAGRSVWALLKDGNWLDITITVATGMRKPMGDSRSRLTASLLQR